MRKIHRDLSKNWKSDREFVFLKKRTVGTVILDKVRKKSRKNTKLTTYNSHDINTIIDLINVAHLQLWGYLCVIF